MCIGAVVKSKTGRDRYRLYVIVGVTEDGRALIANGRLCGILRCSGREQRKFLPIGIQTMHCMPICRILRSRHKNHEETPKQVSAKW